MGRPRKSTGAELVSIGDCERTMATLLVAITDIETLIAEKDMAVASASAKFEGVLDDAKARRIEAEVALRNYYYAHAAEIEKGGAKHCQLANGVMGRRFNPPALQPLNRKWGWKEIRVAVRERWGALYFHDAKAPEIDKEKLKELTAEQLATAGLRVKNEEVFYAEPARLPEGEA